MAQAQHSLSRVGSGRAGGSGTAVGARGAGDSRAIAAQGFGTGAGVGGEAQITVTISFPPPGGERDETTLSGERRWTNH